MDARNLLRQFKNIGNYLRLLFDPDVYGLCKLYPVTGWLNPTASRLLSFICRPRREILLFKRHSSLFVFSLRPTYDRTEADRSIRR